MFRPMRRFAQQLSDQECGEVLAGARRGVLAVRGEDGYPYAFPMNFCQIDGKIYFHSALEGHKLDALAADNRASFCVTDGGYREAGEWALRIRSVVIFGRIRVIADESEALGPLRALGLKYYPTPESAEEEAVKNLPRARVLEMTVDHMTGKRVKES